MYLDYDFTDLEAKMHHNFWTHFGNSCHCAVHCAANPACSGSSICMPESDMLLVCKLTSLSALIDVRVCTAEHKYWVNRNRICSYCSQTVDYHSDTHLHTSFKICIVLVLEDYLKKGYLSPIAVMSSMNQG